MPARSFSIVLAAHNGANYLDAQLRSIAAQDLLPVELIICDDASTDATPKIVANFSRTAPFAVSVHRNEIALGSTGNFASGFSRAVGNWIAPCDQDDVWHPDKLAKFDSALDSSPRADLVFCDADAVDEELRPLGYSLWQSIGFAPALQTRARQRGLLSVLSKLNVVTGAAMAFRASRRSELLPIPGTWVHDGWIAMILSAMGETTHINEKLLAYRQHCRQQIGASQNTLARQINTARQMDADYFHRLEHNITQVIDRLQMLGESDTAPNHCANAKVNSGALHLLSQKLLHCHNRAALRERRRRMVSVAWSELRNGRYTNCSLGWKSLAQDLFLS